MSAGTWFVDASRAAVNWGTAVSGGTAAINIYRLVVDVSGLHETTYLWREVGAAASAGDVTAAQAATTGGSVPAPLLPGSPVAPGGTGVGTTGLADGAVTLPKLSTGVQTSIGKADGSAQKASNLSDVASASTSRTNLGLGTAATLASSAVAQTANNLSDVASAATSRTNLGLGAAATMTPTSIAADTALTSTYAHLLVTDATSSAGSGTLTAWHLTPVDATSGAATRTLPAASSVTAGVETAVKKADTSANTVTVSRAGSDLIFGTGSGSTSKALTLAGEAVTLVSNGTDRWTIQTSDTPSGVLASTYVQRRSGTSNPAAPLPFANVRDYGAVGDGTTDDTAAVQAFLNAWAANGGDFVIPQGTYKVSTTVSVSPTVAGRLYAYGAVIKASGTFPISTYLFSLSGSSVAIHGLILDGNSLANRLLRIADNSSRLRIVDCEFRNSAQQATESDLNTVGVFIEGNCTGIDIDRCYFHDLVAGGNSSLASFSRGILIGDPHSVGVTTHVKVRGCSFENIKSTGISTDADGICIQNMPLTSTWLLVDSCSFKNLHKRAVKIQCPGVTVSNCTIQNDYLGANGVQGLPDPQVYAAISVYADDCLIANNNIIGGSWLNGIEVGTSIETHKRITVIGNRVIGGATASMAGSGGIRVNGDNASSEIVIVGNYVGRFINGIWLSTAAAGIVVSGNQVNAYGVASTSGIYIDGQSSVQPTRLAIVGNTFEGTTRYGIETTVVPTDMTVVGNMGGRTGFEILSISALTSFLPTSRRTYAAANGGGGSVSTGADGVNGTSLPFGGSFARVIRTNTAITYSASMTPAAQVGDWQTITATNGTAFTVNAPTNPPSAAQSQKMTIEVINSAGGALGTITWNAAFVFAGQTWTNPASTKKRYATFEWNGAAWICTAVAAADY